MAAALVVALDRIQRRRVLRRLLRRLLAVWAEEAAYLGADRAQERHEARRQAPRVEADMFGSLMLKTWHS